MVFFFAYMLMHQPGKKIKNCRNFGVFQARDEGLQEKRVGKSLEKGGQGAFVRFPVQAEAYLFCFHENLTGVCG